MCILPYPSKLDRVAVLAVINVVSVESDSAGNAETQSASQVRVEIRHSLQFEPPSSTKDTANQRSHFKSLSLSGSKAHEHDTQNTEWHGSGCETTDFPPLHRVFPSNGVFRFGSVDAT